MNNIELEVLQLQGGRFVEIPYGMKGPQTPGWQHNPKKLEQIPDNRNIGLLLGKHTGIMAIDFDGTWGQDWFATEFGSLSILPATVTWTSGKDGRAQMAFTVPEEHWGILKTIKRNEKLNGDEGRKAEGIEFRFHNVQSVMPPSMHPETQRPYEWLAPPVEVSVQPLPQVVLDWWLKECTPEPIKAFVQYDPVDPSVREEEVVTLLKFIKDKRPKLEYGYWTTIIWSTYHALGDNLGLTIQILSNLWPPQKRGDYESKLKGEYRGKKVEMGTLVKLAKDDGYVKVSEFSRIMATGTPLQKAKAKLARSINKF